MKLKNAKGKLKFIPKDSPLWGFLVETGCEGCPIINDCAKFELPGERKIKFALTDELPGVKIVVTVEDDSHSEMFGLKSIPKTLKWDEKLQDAEFIFEEGVSKWLFRQEREWNKDIPPLKIKDVFFQCTDAVNGPDLSKEEIKKQFPMIDSSLMNFFDSAFKRGDATFIKFNVEPVPFFIQSCDCPNCEGEWKILWTGHAHGIGSKGVESLKKVSWLGTPAHQILFEFKPENEKAEAPDSQIMIAEVQRVKFEQDQICGNGHGLSSLLDDIMGASMMSSSFGPFGSLFGSGSFPGAEIIDLGPGMKMIKISR